MSKKTDSNSYTMIFAIGMVLVVGSLLAFLASSLKPNISENKRIEKQQNILYAMGVNENDESSAIFVSTSVAEQEFQKPNIFHAHHAEEHYLTYKKQQLKLER